jgi:hypothetical protein
MSGSICNQDDELSAVSTLINIERSTVHNFSKVLTLFGEDIEAQNQSEDDIFLVLLEKRKLEMLDTSLGAILPPAGHPTHIATLQVNFDIHNDSRESPDDIHNFTSDVISVTRKGSDLSSISSDGAGWRNSRKIQLSRKGTLDLNCIIQSSLHLNPYMEGDTPPTSPVRDSKEIDVSPKKKKLFSVKKFVPKFLRRRSFSWGSSADNIKNVGTKIGNNDCEEPASSARHFARRRTL